MDGPEHIPKSPLGGVSAFQCGNCGGQVKLHAPGQTMRAACTHCGALIDLTNPDFTVLEKYNRKMRYKPLIPIGTRGVVQGTEWEVIGFMVRKVVDYPYQWEEYLLFNPYQGFRWLLNQYGHWSFTTPLLEYPKGTGGRDMVYEGKRFQAYGKGKAQVIFVFGEFYWEVKRGEKVDTRDLVKAPEMLSLEFDASGKNWTKSVYLYPEEVKASFGKDLKLPPQKGVAPHQPNPYWARLKAILPIYLIALILLIIGQFWLYLGNNETLYSDSGPALIADASGIQNMEEGRELVSPPFQIGGNTGNVEVSLTSPGINNSWLEGQGYLRNMETNKTYPFNVTAEYYSGYTDGESWSEGNRRGTKIINLVPGGNYELVVQLYSGKPDLRYIIAVKRNVTIYTNFLIVFVLITLPILYLGFMTNDFKKKQWLDSDFS